MRVRVNGELIDVKLAPVQAAAVAISYPKVMGNLDFARERLAQRTAASAALPRAAET